MAWLMLPATCEYTYMKTKEMVLNLNIYPIEKQIEKCDFKTTKYRRKKNDRKNMKNKWTCNCLNWNFNGIVLFALIEFLHINQNSLICDCVV